MALSGTLSVNTRCLINREGEGERERERERKEIDSHFLYTAVHFETITSERKYKIHTEDGGCIMCVCYLIVIYEAV